MLTLDQIIEKLNDRNLSKVADAVGVSRATMSNLKNRKVNPSYELVKKLSDYLES
jgi:transcriptional regulator with XRE-family HTH domain